jgi:hypothetical protein
MRRLTRWFESWRRSRGAALPLTNQGSAADLGRASSETKGKGGRNKEAGFSRP